MSDLNYSSNMTDVIFSQENYHILQPFVQPSNKGLFLVLLPTLLQ